jgi:hypothetical protein
MAALADADAGSLIQSLADHGLLRHSWLFVESYDRLRGGLIHPSTGFAEGV